MNMTKKLSIVFLIVISILSTAFLYKSNAVQEYSGAFGDENRGFVYYERESHVKGEYNNEYNGFEFTTLNEDMRGRLIIESVRQHSYDGGNYIPLSDLYDFYDVLCCQKGTKLPSENETYLVGNSGDRLPLSYPHLTQNDVGMLTPEQEGKFPSSIYKSLTLGFYVPEEEVIAGPKEAYILAEMVKELEGAVFYYDFVTDANGNKVRYEGSLEAAERFYIGDEEIYIVEKEYVVTLPDGENVRVEGVSDGRGGIVYKYKEGHYKNHYEKYEGKLTWSDSKLGSGGTYPSFECTNSSSSVNTGVVRDDSVVAPGTPIYVTGSNIVVKDGDSYYRATIEGNNSYIQLAWWTTVYPESIGNLVADTAFSQEADAFEAYILAAAGGVTREELKYRTEIVIDEETGEEKEIENAFDIKYEPQWITEEVGDYDYENPVTVFEEDKQSLLVGPFGLDYIEARAQFGGRPEVEFAGITGMELYTDASDEPLELDIDKNDDKKGDWELVYIEGGRTEEESNDEKYPLIYPKSNEPFYIRIFDADNGTQIKNIKVHFRFMNAAGSWQKLNGNYFEATWRTADEDGNEYHRAWDVYKPEPQYDEEGNFTGYESVYDHTEHRYWLKLHNLLQQPSQALALGIKGAKWYKTTELERKVGINEGKVVVEKELVDAGGKPIESIDDDDKFTFEVTVTGAKNSDTEILKVKAGDSVESQVYYWMDGEEAPTYEVKEIKIPDGYKLVSIENATGKLKPFGKEPVPVKAINEVKPNSGSINVIKVMEPTNMPGTTLVGQTFDFNVKISGTFTYNGEEIINGSKDVPITVTAGADAGSATPVTVGPVYWYGDEAPTYVVTENKKEGAQLISINPDTGKFVANQEIPTTVTATNKQEIEKASVRIIKTLKGSSEFTREYIESLVFKFALNVDGHEKESIVLNTPTRQDENGDWVWEGVSSEYTWLYGNNPNYTISEVEVPKGTTFNSGESTVSGTLRSNKQENYEVKNNIINNVTDSNSKKIKITKVVEDADLVNKDYKFLVIVKGVAFRYTHTDGTTYNCNSDQMMQIYDGGAVVLDANADYDYEKFITVNAASTDGVNGTGTKETGTFTWYGDKAPNYIVKETLLGQDIASSVEPSEGSLAAGETDTIEVTAWNREIERTRGGYIHIIKTLEDAEKFSIEYIKSLVFKFDIEVEGYNKTTVALEPKLVDNTWVWEYTSERYSWKDGQSAPSYKITEVDLPEGTEFLSATGPEGSTVSGTTVEGKLKESVSQEVLITTDNSFINKVNGPHSDELIIEKKVTHDSLNGKEFKFDVTLKGTFEYNGTQYTNTEFVVEDIVVKGGEKSSPIKVTWYGEVAPTYAVTEEDSEIAKQVSIQNGAGSFSYEKEGSQVATFTTVTNEPKLVGGQLIITKNIDNGSVDKAFLFEVKIGNENSPSFTVSLKAGEIYKSDMYKWYISEEAPKYWVREINPNDGSSSNLGYEWQTGQLSSTGDAVVSVDYINTYVDQTGKFKVRKVVLDEKLIDTSKDAEFKIKATVTGTFNITKDDGSVVGVNNGSRTFDITLKGGETFTSPTITWWGNEAPTVTVEEYSIPFGWKNLGISNNGTSLTENEEVEIVVTNKLPVYVVVDLTTKLGGTVWVDRPLDVNDKNTENSTPNGILDRGENSTDIAKEGVEVYVYKVVFDANGNPINDVEPELAKIYKDLNNTELAQPIITDSFGRWDAPRVKIPTVTEEQKANGWRASYDIRFVYDGQTYEPTTYLATAGGDASKFLNETTAGKDKFANDSMALDIDRAIVNSRVETIKGNSPIAGNGETVGTAIASDGTESILNYKSKEISGDAVRIDGEVSKIKSELITTDENGIALDLFKTTATTGSTGLTFPFYKDTQSWNGFVLLNENTTLTEIGVEQAYLFEAVYNYCLNINLGLVERPDADLGAAKDLYSAKVTVKGESDETEYYSYRFNKLSDIDADYYTRQLQEQAVTAEYTLGLYSTDYYYRAEMYNAAQTDLFDKLVEAKKDITTVLDADEMEVELTYRIVLYNESGTYTEVVKSLVDYYDASFDINDVNEIVITDKAKDGNVISCVKKDGDKGIVSIRKYKENPSDSEYKQDKQTFNALVIDDLNIELASGEFKELFMTVKVDKATIKGVHDTIIASRKSNIAEIGSYTTKYADGTLAGKIDKDSAPDNANIRDYNYNGWYEDDTDSAPVLYLTVAEQLRTVAGQVWEDKAEADTTVGNGIIDSDEAIINGLTTQLVEKITVKETLEDGTSVERDYDFIWPTNKGLNSLGGKSIKDVTGFDSTIESAPFTDETTGDVTQGAYKFEGIPSGKYVVRFLYGNDKTELDDKLDITADPVAVDASGNSFSGTENILTANYDNDLEGETAAVYNGQDYKATVYQKGFATVDGNGYINNRYHNLEDQALADARVSDARDSEARRLEITAKSETITNTNGNILATANDKAADHSKLYKEYYMFADTAILDLDLDNPAEGVITVNNIDCGLIERPETEIILDKQISSIKLITNDQRVIFNADYDISYEVTNRKDGTIISEVEDGKYLVANVTLKESSIGTDVMQALNKFENKLPGEDNQGIQNFRFINVDDTILHGATVELNYQMTALNMSEVDYTSDFVNKIFEEEIAADSNERLELVKLAKEAKENISRSDVALEVGKYLGTSYYTGNIGNDKVVTTRVRQVVDYVDNDAVFAAQYNNTKDHMWRPTNITELSGNGYDFDRILDRAVLPAYSIMDKHGREYIADGKTNIILSVDTVGTLETTSDNSGFENTLEPYAYYLANKDVDAEAAFKSQIALMVSKTVSAQDKDLTYDNLAEIVKVQNTAGRRDVLSIPGNANPKLGEFTASIQERDASATELVTFTPPTGIKAETPMTTQVLIVTLVALVIVAVGIVIIKKKVL